jgi:hypothetical protein
MIWDLVSYVKMMGFFGVPNAKDIEKKLKELARHIYK